jgi:hypothetical protein
MAAAVEEYSTLKEERTVAPPPPTKLTLAQANKLAAGRPFELIDGRMVFKMADYDHSQTQMLLGGELLNYFKANPHRPRPVGIDASLVAGERIRRACA